MPDSSQIVISIELIIRILTYILRNDEKYNREVLLLLSRYYYQESYKVSSEKIKNLVRLTAINAMGAVITLNYINTNLYGEVIAPGSVTELFETLIEKSSGEVRGIHFWRGQSSIQWPIDSGAVRRMKISNEALNNRRLRSYELNLLNKAKHKGFHFVNNQVISDIELLARLQHHGAATRLVDFSKNSLVALWFSVSSNFDETGFLIGISSDHVAGSSEGIMTSSYKTFYSELMLKIERSKNPYFIETPIVTNRIAAQHAVFLMSGIVNENRGSLILPKEENIYIAISPQLKKKVLKVLLESFDIRMETLFPDLDGFSLVNKFDSDLNNIFRW